MTREAPQSPLGASETPALRLRAWLLRLPRGGYALLALGWGGFIWWLSSIGADDDAWLARLPTFTTNLGHAVVFGALALWLALALPRSANAPRLDLPGRAFVLVLAVGYGFLDEWHQSWVPGRHPTLLDATTDGIGAICTVWALAYVGRAGSTGRGLLLRIAISLGLSSASAWFATWYHTRYPNPLWPF